MGIVSLLSIVYLLSCVHAWNFGHRYTAFNTLYPGDFIIAQTDVSGGVFLETQPNDGLIIPQITGNITSAKTAALWHKDSFNKRDIINGFQTIFGLQFNPPYGPLGLGKGVVFGLQSAGATPFTGFVGTDGATDGGSFGFQATNNITQGIGVSIVTTGTALTFSFVVTQDNPSIFPPSASRPWDNATAHSIHIQYDGWNLPKTFYIYYDDSLVLTWAIDIAPYLGENVWVGFTGSTGISLYQSQTIKAGSLSQLNDSWTFVVHNSTDTLYWAAPSNIALYINGVFQSATPPANGRPSILATNYLTQSLNFNPIPGRVLAIRASNLNVTQPTGTATLSGFLLDLRVNGTSLDLSDNFRCWNGGAITPNWFWNNNTSPQNYLDPNWTNATVLGLNDVNSLNFPTVNRYHPFISRRAQRLWKGTDTTIYCRTLIPRYCNGAVNYCSSNETCNFLTNQCDCKIPFRRIGPAITDTCIAFDPPTITRISVTYAQILRSNPIAPFSIEITGSTINQNTTQLGCLVGGRSAIIQDLNATSVTCSMPTGTFLPGVYNVNLENLRGIVASRSNSLPIVLWFDFQISNISINEGSIFGGDKVSIFGDISSGNPNFYSELTYFCRFVDFFNASSVSLAVQATWENNRTISITTPVPPAAGIYRVSCSVDQITWFTGNPTFTFRELASIFCETRSPTEDFPFVINNRGLGNGTFFPYNLAAESTAVVSSPAPSIKVSQLFDNEFCCPNDLSGACGVQFTGSIGTDSVTLTFRKEATINQIVTSWKDYCQTLPPIYQVYVLNQLTGGLDNISKIFSQSCSSFPGKSIILSIADWSSGEVGNQVAICPTYFKPISTTQIRLEWDQSIGNSSAWLYELAVHGIYEDYPFSMTAPSWNTPNVPIDNLSIGDIQLSFSSYGGIVPISWNEAYFNQLNLELYSSDGTNLTPQITSPRNGTFSTSPATVFTGVTLTGLNIGSYNLKIVSPVGALVPLNLPFSVVAGAPVYLTTNVRNTLLRSARIRVELGPITFCVYDLNRNLLSTPVNVLARNNDTVALRFTFSRTVIGCTTVQSILMERVNPNVPMLGSFNVIFYVENPYIPADVIKVDVSQGPPSKLVYSGPTIYDNNRFASIPTIALADDAGNLASTSDFENGTVKVTITPNPSNLNGTTAFVNGGKALFSFLSFQGIRSATYNMQFQLFSISNDPQLPPTVITFSISNCNNQGEVINPSDPYSCACGPGYERKLGLCSACSIGFYKNDTGDTECTQCEVGVKTTSTTGSSSCVCDNGHYLNGTECITCPTGAQCGNNFITGNQAGYWQSKVDPTLFYNCYKSEIPSYEERDASEEACPAGNSVCGEAYTGIRCLVCADGYGTSGPFCKKCPEQTTNWAIVVGCGLIALVLLVFLVYQGRTPKNKESVSTKILLNHIQMLALLSVIGALWTRPFLSILSIGGIATFMDNNVVSADCAFDVSYYYEFGFFMLIPFFTFAFCSVVYLLVYLVRAYIVPRVSSGKAEAKTDIRRATFAGFILANIIINFIVYPAICYKVLEIFDCDIEVDGSTYLHADPSIQCGTSGHIPYVIWGIIMLVVFCIGLPLVAVIILAKYRNTENVHTQMIIRFLYDGFKHNRFYWEVVIMYRKFLITVVITLTSTLQYQIYGMTFIVQAALLGHLLLHPYISGRQFRLELWSLVAMLITLLTNLYIIEESYSGTIALTLSSIVLTLHILVVLGFLFFIGRGLMRRFLSKTWGHIRNCWTKLAPKKLDKPAPKFSRVMRFIQMFADASDKDKKIVLENLEVWWKKSPMYKKKRLLNVLSTVSQGTPYGSKLHSSSRGGDDDFVELGVIRV